MSIGVCQTADTEDNLRLGRALGDAIAESDRKVVLIASGAMSHTFWPLRKLRDHEAAGVEHIFSPEAAAADHERMQWFEAGDHARVLDTMPEFYRYKPEARFGHYLMMIGALGEGDCTRNGSAATASTRTRSVPGRCTVVRPAGGRLPAARRTPPSGRRASERRPGLRRRLNARRGVSMRETRRILLDGNAVDVVRARRHARRGRRPRGRRR